MKLKFKKSHDIDKIKNICDKIYMKYELGKKPPIGNQNCMLCTWCVEAQLRDINILPRPVYSPRDIIFTIKPYSFVKDGVEEKFESIDDLKTRCITGRYYVHINWKDSESGHEFILMSFNGNRYIVDAQADLIATIDSKKGKEYFDNCNYDNSYIVRIDDKPLDFSVLAYNMEEYITPWEDSDKELC